MCVCDGLTEKRVIDFRFGSFIIFHCFFLFFVDRSMPFKFGVNSVCQLDRINNVQLNVGTRLSTATIAIASAISFVFFVDDREIFARLLSITSVISPLCHSAMIIPFNAVIFHVAVVQRFID